MLDDDDRSRKRWRQSGQDLPQRFYATQGSRDGNQVVPARVEKLSRRLCGAVRARRINVASGGRTAVLKSIRHEPLLA
jgi:hypothetical protein